MTTIRKHYADTSYGQVHVRSIAATGDEISAPLVCLHPAPASGLYFTTVMPLLNAGRRVLAIDYPGYGGSDSPQEPLTVADYARAATQALESSSVAEPYDLLGFHTGCLIAAEMKQAKPDRVRRLLLCDIPYFTTEQQDALREKMTRPLPVGADLECLAGAWKFDVSGRLDHVPLRRAFELFAERLRSGSEDCAAFRAAFTYDCETRLSALKGDVVCLATQSSLHAPTTAAASVIPDATLVDVPEVTAAVFEAGAHAISKRIAAALEPDR